MESEMSSISSILNSLTELDYNDLSIVKALIDIRLKIMKEELK